MAQPSSDDISVRDQLIANQENLLNTYRCLYQVDVGVVPGGCPNPDTTVPGAAPESPTQADLDVREGLIQSQETLLNVYRCRFGVDTQLVPGGCPDGPEPGDDTAQPPAGGFTALAAARLAVCGLRADGTIACWGHPNAELSAPQGRFTAIGQFGRRMACAIRADRTVVCWNYRDSGGRLTTTPQTVEPSGQFNSLVYAGTAVCGLRTDGSVVCWKNDEWDIETTSPEGEFTSIIGGGEVNFSPVGDHGGFVCGIKVDRTVACWSEGSVSALPVDSDGQYTEIIGTFATYGWPSQTCGLGVDRVVVCWGPDAGGFNTLAGQYTDIAFTTEFNYGQTLLCGLRVDKTLSCLDPYGNKQDSPPGQYTAIATAPYGNLCALRTDQTLACWEVEAGQGPRVLIGTFEINTNTPDGTFTAFAGKSEKEMCAAKADGNIACWTVSPGPTPGYDLFDAGSEPWIQCELGADGTVTCGKLDLYETGETSQDQFSSPPGVVWTP